jgi:hypothetical protein
MVMEMMRLELGQEMMNYPRFLALHHLHAVIMNKAIMLNNLKKQIK